MDIERVTPKARGEGRIVLIKSFTDPATHYKVDLAAFTCSCPHSRINGAFCKHRILAEAVVKARQVKFGKYAAEESVLRHVRQMFRALTPEESYTLVCDILSSPYATKRMRNTALARHAKLVAA